MEVCPYCSGLLLRYVRCHETYWFCRHCWTQIPSVVVQQAEPAPSERSLFPGGSAPCPCPHRSSHRPPHQDVA